MNQLPVKAFDNVVIIVEQDIFLNLETSFKLCTVCSVLGESIVYIQQFTDKRLYGRSDSEALLPYLALS